MITTRAPDGANKIKINTIQEKNIWTVWESPDEKGESLDSRDFFWNFTSRSRSRVIFISHSLLDLDFLSFLFHFHFSKRVKGNYFQVWIFFRGEYFSGVNIFQGWIFLRLIFLKVNIFHIWISPSEDSHNLLGLVFTFIEVWENREAGGVDFCMINWY